MTAESPKVYQDLVDRWEDVDRRRASLDAYARGERSFVAYLLPELAVRLSGVETLALLRRRFGPAVDLALHPDHTDPCASPGDRLPDDLFNPSIDQARRMRVLFSGQHRPEAASRTVWTAPDLRPHGSPSAQRGLFHEPAAGPASRSRARLERRALSRHPLETGRGAGVPGVRGVALSS